MAISALIAAIATWGPVVTGGAASTLFGLSAFTSFLVRTAIGLALNALTPKPRSRGANRGYQVTTRGSALDHQIIYGRMRVGGVIVFDKTTGSNNKFLHRVIAFAGHEIESFDEIYIDDEILTTGGEDYSIDYSYTNYLGITVTETATLTAVPAADFSYSAGEFITATEFVDLFDSAAEVDNIIRTDAQRSFSIEINSITTNSSNIISGGKYSGAIRVNEHLGSSDQEADSDLVSEVEEWTAEHRLRGIAYLYVRLKFDRNVFPNGVPDITAVVKGKKIYDPREGTHDADDPSTWEWSDNSALCIRDYLSSGYGLNEDDDNIDDSLVTTAANVCDETDTLAGTKRYTCNGAFVLQVAPVDILNDMLTSMGGLLWYAQGEWRMKPAYYVAPTVSFDEDDLRSSISVQTRHSRRDNFNTVRGTFRGEESNWQVTDFPEVSNSDFLEEDNDQESVLDLELPFTDNSIEARRIARIVLERNRQQLSVSASFGLRGFQVQTGDIIQFSIDRFGWSSKEFEVTSWTFGVVDDFDLQVQMTLREITESVFDEVDDGETYLLDNTTLLSPLTVPDVGISAVSETLVVNEKLSNILQVTVSSGDPEYIDHVEVEYKASADTEFTSAGSGELGVFRLVDLDATEFDIRARAVNTFGIKGNWAIVYAVPADAILSPPEDVSNFTAEVNGGTIHLEWDAVSDLDLSYYKIRHSNEETGATWADATTAVDKVPRPATSITLPTRPGTYHIKSVDKVGIRSENYTSVVVSSDNIESFANTDSQTEDPTFGGTKTGCSVVDSALEITDPSSAPSSATYDFSTYIDTGSVRRVRSRVQVEVIRKDTTAGLFDDLPGLFDDLPGLFDDLTSTPDFADTNVQTYISTTEDDPAGTPTWTDYQLFRAGEYYGRAFRFRAILRSTADDITPSVTGLTALVEYN